MLDQIIAALGRHPKVSDWTVRRRRSHSAQLFLIGREIESRREVTTEDYDLDVYNDHPVPSSARRHDGSGAGMEEAGTARGVASVKLVPADADRLAQRVDEAVLMATLVHNPRYTLPEPAPYPTVALAEPALATPAGRAEATWDFAGRLWSLVDQERGVRLSAAEVFVTYTELELRNSRGIAAASSGTRVMAELTLLAAQGGEEAEHFRTIEARRLEGLRLPYHVAEAAAFARDTLGAGVPKTRTGPVVLAGQALAPLFDAVTFQASAGAVYSKLASAEVGHSILGERETSGERLTVRSNAVRPYGLRSYVFDQDGVPGQDTLLVQDGILRARQATQRYAQYLKVPVTGEPGTTQVLTGPTPLDELLQAGDGPIFYVLAFSAPDVDSVTGDFGSEIRLGYEVTRRGRRPIKGGSVSGNVFDGFANARFCREELELGEYVGPQAVRFASLRVAGE
jgi:PmbA protein